MSTRRQLFELASGLALVSAALPAIAQAKPEATSRRYASRLNFGAPLEPIDRILHGAGQDIDGYKTYASLLPAGNKPAIYMTYVGIAEGVAAVEGWGQQVMQDISKIADHQPALQVGLWLRGPDGKPWDQRIAAGEHDREIRALAQALGQFNRPVYLRIGYEFEGAWNGYQAETFKACWKRIAAELARHQLPIALVWCSAGGAAGWKDLSVPMSYYPGDEHVDWWGIDLFDSDSLTDPRTHAFLDAARAHKKPVMIGESSSKGVGTLEGEKSWAAWYVPYFALMSRRPEIKAFCYINWEWDYWAKKFGFDWHDWGDCRIEQSPVVRAR